MTNKVWSIKYATMKESKPGIGVFKRKTFVWLFLIYSTTFIPLIVVSCHEKLQFFTITRIALIYQFLNKLNSLIYFKRKVCRQGITWKHNYNYLFIWQFENLKTNCCDFKTQKVFLLWSLFKTTSNECLKGIVKPSFFLTFVKKSRFSIFS